jgi:hypothetical protein
LNGSSLHVTNVTAGVDCPAGSTFATGSPGIGFFLHNLTGTGQNNEFGFSSAILCEVGASCVATSGGGRMLLLGVGN